MHKVPIVVTAWIILSRNQNIAVTFHSKIMFLSVYRSKITVIMVSVVLIIQDGKQYTLPILLWMKFSIELCVILM